MHSLLIDSGSAPRKERETMPTFTISSRISGAVLGEYDGATADAAIESMHRDAGYRSSAAAADALSTTVDALRAELRVELVDRDGAGDGEGSGYGAGSGSGAGDGAGAGDGE